MNQFGLSQSTIDSIYSVFKKHLVTRVLIYGSRANGSFREGSDIDLTIQDTRLTLKSLALIENEIDDLLLPYKVDLSLYHQIENPDLIEHINRVGKEFYP